MKIAIELPAGLAQSWGPQEWDALKSRLQTCIAQEVQRAAPAIAASPDQQSATRAAIESAVRRAFALHPGAS